MKEIIDWQKELLESGNLMINFQRISLNMVQRILCKGSILFICIPDGGRSEV